MKVVITPRGFANYGLDQVELLKSRGLNVHYNDTGKAYSPEEFLNYSQDASAIIVGVDKIDRPFIDACPNLKVVCKFGVGTDNIDVEYAQSKGIYVGRTLGSNSNAVAEHVMALIYSESKNIYQTVKEVKEHQWNKPTGVEVKEKTLGIVGFGAIGKHLAKQATGVGMKVLVHDVFDIPDEVLTEYQAKKVSFDEIIEEVDYLSLHLPLTKETENLIAEAELKKMKSTACLINTARGGIVNEEDLEKALLAGEIRSACFDVFSTEPPSKEATLVELDNFFLTPHTGARTEESEIRTCQLSTQIVLEQLAK